MSTNNVIYVLALEHGCFYVGRTQRRRLETRIDEHKSVGCGWTRLHKFVSIVCVQPMVSNFDEDNVTKSYMMQYGIENVRGGSYNMPTLHSFQVQSLEVEFKGANDVCFKCGQSGHYISDCREEDNYQDDLMNDYQYDTFVDSDACATSMYIVDSDVF